MDTTKEIITTIVDTIPPTKFTHNTKPKRIVDKYLELILIEEIERNLSTDYS